MLNISKAFSSFSVNDIQKAKEFYGKTLGLELASGPEGTLVVPLSGDGKALMYPKSNHQHIIHLLVRSFPIHEILAQHFVLVLHRHIADRTPVL